MMDESATFNPALSFYYCGQNPSVPKGIYTLSELHARIVGPNAKPVTERLRKLLADGDKSGYDREKNRLLAVTAAGHFEYRNAEPENLIQHSELFALDYDHLSENGQTAEEVRNALILLPEVALAFISPSADGVKAFVRVVIPDDITPELHSLLYARLLTWAAGNANPDVNNSDVSRLTYICHDPDAYLNLDAVALDVSVYEPFKRPQTATQAATRPTNRQSGVMAPEHLLEWLDGLKSDRGDNNRNEWLAISGHFKAAGGAFEDWAAWVRKEVRGKPKTDAGLLKQWNRLPEGQLTRPKIVDLWRTDNPGKRLPGPALQFTGDSLQAAADFLSPDLRRLFRVVEESDYWWAFDGKIWKALIHKGGVICQPVRVYLTNHYQELAAKLQDAGHTEAADIIGLRRSWSSSSAALTVFFARLRQNLAGNHPAPNPNQLCTPAGVVDLETGLVTPHAPEHELRAITAGNYRPNDAQFLYQLLLKRFAKVFDPDILDDILRHIGLALTGRAQTHRAIGLFIGDSGSGKGGALNTFRTALGDYAGATTRDWILSKSNSNGTDPDAATFLEKQTLLVTIDEIGSADTPRLLALTGDAQTTASRKFGQPISGTFRFAILTTAVAPPDFNRGGGIQRRMAVYPTLSLLQESDFDPLGGFDQDLLDAVVTIAIDMAAYVYLPGYIPPKGDSGAKETVLANADPLGTWIVEQDNLDGVESKDAMNWYKNTLSIDDAREITARVFGLAVNKSGVYRIKPSNGKQLIRRI